MKQKFESAKEKAGLVKESALDRANIALEQHWSLVRQLWCERVDPSVRSVVMDDEKLKASLRAIHGALPLPLRLVVKKDSFIRVCLNNRDRWMPKEEGDEEVDNESGSGNVPSGRR